MYSLDTLLPSKPSCNEFELVCGADLKYQVEYQQDVEYCILYSRGFGRHIRLSLHSPFQQVKNLMCVSLSSLHISRLSRGSRTPYWGLGQSPSWMPASSRKGKSSGGEGPVGPLHRGGHRVRSASRTSRPFFANIIMIYGIEYVSAGMQLFHLTVQYFALGKLRLADFSNKILTNAISMVKFIYIFIIIAGLQEEQEFK